MNEKQAREILGKIIDSQDNLDISQLINDTDINVGWYSKKPTVYLDGDFTADQLEAIAWWIRNKT